MYEKNYFECVKTAINLQLSAEIEKELKASSYSSVNYISDTLKNFKSMLTQQRIVDFVKEIQSHPLLKDIDVNINNANDYALFLEEYNNCLKCQGLNNCSNTTTGFSSVIEDGSLVARPCKYKKQALLKAKESKLIKTLFIPQRILNADLANYNNNTENRKKIYKYIINFINSMKNNEFVQGLYIYGAFSTGKTYILGCIANELARNNIKSLIIYFPDLVVELKSAIGTPRFEELLNHLKSVDVLLLDDLGSENMTPWASIKLSFNGRKASFCFFKYEYFRAY